MKNGSQRITTTTDKDGNRTTTIDAEDIKAIGGAIAEIIAAVGGLFHLKKKKDESKEQ